MNENNRRDEDDEGHLFYKSYKLHLIERALMNNNIPLNKMLANFIIKFVRT